MRRRRTSIKKPGAMWPRLKRHNDCICDGTGISTWRFPCLIHYRRIPLIPLPLRIILRRVLEAVLRRI